MAASVFDEQAERYDSWYRKHPEILECEVRAVRALGLRGRGLAIGVGTGVIDSQSGVATGVDPALNMLKLAAKRGVEPIRSVGEYLPFRNRSFDFAVMTATLCFTDHPRKVLAEINRVLRTRGSLGVCIITRDSTWGAVYTKKAEGGHVFYRHGHFYTAEELKKLLAAYSFGVVSVKATLSYGPDEPPRVEEPADNPDGKGFVCFHAVKLNA